MDGQRQGTGSCADARVAAAVKAAPFLERLTQVINEARTDNGSSQGEQRDMNVETTLETNAQFAETGKPGMRALDYPAIPAEPLLTFHATAGDAGRDAALPQVTTAACKVIAFVRM